MGDGPLAINQGYYVDSCSSAVCHFCTNIIFCFVNGPNIWNLNMFLVHLHKQMQCGIHLELGKCTITVHIFLHTTAHFGKIINTSAIKNEQILALEVFYKHSLFLNLLYGWHLHLFSIRIDLHIPQHFNAFLILLAWLTRQDFPSDPFSPISSVWPK